MVMVILYFPWIKAIKTEVVVVVVVVVVCMLVYRTGDSKAKIEVGSLQHRPSYDGSSDHGTVVGCSESISSAG